MRFPVGKYGRQTMEFFPAPYKAPLRSFAALVFPWQEDQVLLCDICDRGWCIPSGRVEAYESSYDAAIREAREEAGAVLSDLVYLGCYRITERQEVRWADVYVADIVDLKEITHDEESLGRKFVSQQELPDAYHMWDELLQAMFQHAYNVIGHHREVLRKFN